MSDATKAVFLSYAHDDAAAAQRIAEALRGFGVEVWFDQNELRGGDQWDAKIRGQIKSCALFIPIISQTTQSRDEAYFRLEWKLADDRSHLMAPGKAFVVPVVIDATSEYAAAVPESFTRAQWTRLADGLPSTAFIEQVKRLLNAPVTSVSAMRSPQTTPRDATPPAQQLRAAGALVWIWPLAAVVLAVAGYFGWQSTRPGKPAAPALMTAASAAPAAAPATALDKSVAVLPFANLSPDPENAFFADGMHDDLITALAKIRDLKVISRTSVMPYKTGSRNLRKIAEELGVGIVLEGSVQRIGNRVRINMQLIDARTDAHLWAETYNRELTDVFTIQAALTQEITTALKANFTNDERVLIARRPTQNQEAYDLYLRARVLEQNLEANSPLSDYQLVVDLYEHAAKQDPNFALAHVQASILNGSIYWFGALDASPARRARTLAGVEAARRLAPDAPETHLAQGSFEYTCNNDWKQALVEYRKAETALPNDAQLHYRIGLAHRRLGDMRAALERLERATTLNPHDTRAFTTMIETMFSLRRYADVVTRASRYLNTFPGSSVLMGYFLRAQFELDGDRASYLRKLALLPIAPDDFAGLNTSYDRALLHGDLAAAERALADPRLAWVNSYMGVIRDPVPLHRALLAWLRGETEAARRFADEALTQLRDYKASPRQRATLLLAIAKADAFAGRKEEALRGARAAMAEFAAADAFMAMEARAEFGALLIVCGRREEALAELRAMMGETGQATPHDIRYHPIWSRLKSDPRFEEILKSAKAL